MAGRAFEPGALFKDGRLLVFTAREAMAVRGWPEASALRSERRGGPWQPFEPDFPLVRPYRPRRPAAPTRAESPQLALPLPPEQIVVRPRLSAPQRRARAFASFRFSLPRPVANALEPVRHQQWPLLWLLAGAEEALELCQSSPALAFCVAQRCHRRARLQPVEPDALRRIVARKRRELLGWLRFPDSRSTVRLLGRIEPAALSRGRMLKLRDALRSPQPGEPVARRLAHLRSINTGALAIALEPRLLAASTPSLLLEVAADRRERHHPFAAERLGDTLDMLADLRPGRSRRYDSLARLRQEHDELGLEWCRQEKSRVLSGRFPRPPVPGNGRIEPITSPEGLIREGEAQHNCVASYARRVRARATFVYQVLAPERATLAIVPGPGRSWRRGELLLARNREVSVDTKLAVDRWLETHAL